MSIRFARGLWSKFTAGSDFELIETVTVGAGGAASVTFSSIPGTYKHLQVRALVRDAQASGFNNAQMTFNGDTGTNYSGHMVYGNGTSAASAGYANTANMNVALYFASAGHAAGVFSVGVVDILDYTNGGKYKTARSLTGGDANGSGIVLLTSGSWRSLSAVTSLTISSGATIQQYSSFALYGIKG